MQLHIQRGTEELGTFTQEETTQQLAGGHFLENDLAWPEGLKEKMPLSELLEQLQAQKEGTFDDDRTVSPEEAEGEPQPHTPAPPKK